MSDVAARTRELARSRTDDSGLGEFNIARRLALRLMRRARPPDSRVAPAFVDVTISASVI
jgi:hypothetical protein